ncbi:MAG: cation transporter [Cohaesibacteraceae bacterium]|nr:cation transporter [Cohaesibacteraceae bacterium]
MIFLSVGLMSVHGHAAEQTIRLSIPGMNCASCPYMVEWAIKEVDGVKRVDATLEDTSAIVVFEDSIASIEAIVKATADIGYVSTLVTGASGS